MEMETIGSVQALESLLCCIFESQLGRRVKLLARIQFKSDYHHLAVSDTTPSSSETETRTPSPRKYFQVQDQVRIRIRGQALGGALDKGHGYMRSVYMCT